jgi:hypothetical protein
MEVKKKNFPKILLENEEAYLLHIMGLLDSVDELCSLQITKHPVSYSFRIAPSLPKYTNLIIEELFKYHNLLGIRLDMGKSIKSTAVISFDISINNV